MSVNNARQDNVVFHVEMLVKSGVAKFDPPLPISGLSSVDRNCGWVVLEIIFGEAPGVDSENAEAMEGKTTIERAKAAFSRHQFGTIPALVAHKCEVILRLASFERRECLLKTDRHYNVEVLRCREYD